MSCVAVETETEALGQRSLPGDAWIQSHRAPGDEEKRSTFLNERLVRLDLDRGVLVIGVPNNDQIDTFQVLALNRKGADRRASDNRVPRAESPAYSLAYRHRLARLLAVGSRQ